MSFGRFSVNNRVLINLLVGVILIFGTLVVTLELPVELMPKVGFNWVFIVCIYPGASPEEIELLIVKTIEDDLSEIEDLDHISSTSYEGGGFVWVAFEDISEDDFKDRVRDISTIVDGIDLPEGAEDPVIDEFDTDDFTPILGINLNGPLSESEKNQFADELEQELSEIKDISSILVSGVREREIWIEVKPDLAEKHSISIAEIAGRIAGSNLDLPAGYADAGMKEAIVRTRGKAESPGDFARFIVRNNWLGQALHVDDLATVRDTFEVPINITTMKDLPAVNFSLSKKKKGNSLEIIEAVKETCNDFQKRLPAGCSISYTNDTSVVIKKILGVLLTNAYFGGALVLLILLFILGFRNALYVGLGIPISFLATFIFINYAGFSLNSNSLFALVLVLGIIVDDAIIIVENCFYHFQAGLSRIEAAVIGTDEVVKPVLAATFTTISAFLPLMLLPGIVGKFMKIVPMVLSLALVASIIESFIILPSHFAHWGGRKKTIKSRGFGWIRKIRPHYTRLLAAIIRNRYIVVISMLILTVASLGLIPLVGVEMFADEEVSQFFCFVTMPPGTRLEVTNEVLKQIDEAVYSLPEGEVATTVSTAGVLQGEEEWLFNSDVGQLVIDLYEIEERNYTLDQIIEMMEEKTRDIPGVKSIVYGKTPTGPPTPKAVEIKVRGKYLEDLQTLTEKLKDELNRIPGVYNISSDFKEGKTEYRIIVDGEKASRYGLDTGQVAMAARDAIEGRTATQFRDGDDDVDVIVKYPENTMNSPDEISRLMIPAPTGEMVPLANIARLEIVRGYADVRRFKGERAITVKADIRSEVITADKVNGKIKKKFGNLSSSYPGTSLSFEGEFEEFKEIWRGIGKLFAIGVFLIYLILGAQFKSFIQPFIIILTIPFAFLGAMVGLLVSGAPFSISTMYGMVALAGVAVNDSIVMISFINISREKGASGLFSILQSGRRRLRPIILTSITTILGLLPMAVGLGGKSPVWAPLANTIVWGLSAATILTLLVIPAAYKIAVDDYAELKRRIKGLFSSQKGGGN